VHTLEDVKYTISAFSDIQTNLAAGKYSSGVFPDFSKY